MPDPASRLQAGDVHDTSVVVDPAAYAWRHDWRGRPWHEAVVYELHPGAMGGFDGIRARLAALKRARRHRYRADADRGFSRPAQLGL